MLNVNLGRILAALIFAIGGAAKAQTSPVTAATPANLSVQLDSESATIICREPLTLIASVHNESSGPLTVRNDILDKIQFRVKKGGGATTISLTKNAIIDKPYVPISIPPGGQLGSAEVIVAGWPNQAGVGALVAQFAEPGDYEITAITEDGTTRFESKPIQVKVRETPENEQESTKLISSPPASVTWTVSKTNVAVYEALVEKSPKSAFADYARLTLGHYYLSASYTDKGRDPILAKKAYSYFSAVSPRLPTLKLDSLLQQGGLMGTFPEFTDNEERARFLAALTKETDLAKKVGLTGKAESLIKQSNSQQK